MRTEAPEFKRCCCCFPLRRGLIAWGYIKLTISILMTLYFSATLYMIACFFVVYRHEQMIYHMLLTVVVLAIVIGDVILHIIFLIGAHKKDPKLLKVYYYYSITMLIIMGITGTGGACYALARLMRYFDNFLLTILVSDLSTLFVTLVIQGYLILLVKSEIFKLDNTGSFKFVNNAAEAECTLRIQDPYEKESEDNIHIESEKEKDNNFTAKLEKAQKLTEAELVEDVKGVV